MIGNDVVDIQLAKIESNWQRKGYLDKIFTENEQIYISNSLEPDIAVWNLWTRKEAAYKIWNTQTGLRKFNPTDRKSTRLNSSHRNTSRMPSSA